jgi:hypothetical protein
LIVPITWPILGAMGMTTATAGMAAETATGDPIPGIYTQLGVTAACIVIAWFMLRRSDSRERESTEENRKALQDRIEAEREQRIAAQARAQALEDQLMKIITHFNKEITE